MSFSKSSALVLAFKFAYKSWILIHRRQAASLSHTAAVGTYGFAFMHFCRSPCLGTRRKFMQSKWHWKESCTSAAARPLPYWRQPPGNQWNILQFGSKRSRRLGTEELIYCSLSTTVLLVSLALVGKLLKVSERSPRGCRLSLIGGDAAGPSACL